VVDDSTGKTPFTTDINVSTTTCVRATVKYSADNSDADNLIDSVPKRNEHETNWASVGANLFALCG